MSDDDHRRNQSPQDTPCLNILVADDNGLNHTILNSFLGKMGHKVTSAKTGLAAVTSLKENDFDLILMDIQMPEMDGIAAALLIRAMAGPKSKTPIIACTGDSMEKHIKEYQNSGMNSIISKPLQKDEIVRVINDYLNQRLCFPNQSDPKTKSDSEENRRNNSRRKQEALKDLLKEIGG